MSQDSLTVIDSKQKAFQSQYNLNDALRQGEVWPQNFQASQWFFHGT